LNPSSIRTGISYPRRMEVAPWARADRPSSAMAAHVASDGVRKRWGVARGRLSCGRITALAGGNLHRPLTARALRAAWPARQPCRRRAPSLPSSQAKKPVPLSRIRGRTSRLGNPACRFLCARTLDAIETCAGVTKTLRRAAIRRSHSAAGRIAQVSCAYRNRHVQSEPVQVTPGASPPSPRSKRSSLKRIVGLPYRSCERLSRRIPSAVRSDAPSRSCSYSRSRLASPARLGDRLEPRPSRPEPSPLGASHRQPVGVRDDRRSDRVGRRRVGLGQPVAEPAQAPLASSRASAAGGRTASDDCGDHGKPRSRSAAGAEFRGDSRHAIPARVDEGRFQPRNVPPT
jgi:hypothetical protein